MNEGLSRRDWLKIAGGAALGLLVSACAPRAEQFTIQMQAQNQLEPASLIVPVGSTVIWQNIGTVPQTATCDPAKAPNATFAALPDGATAWDSGDLYPGQTWSYTFATPGRYMFFSRYQLTPSMVGVIQVGT